MRQPIYGLVMILFLAIPFMRDLFESYMFLHMHMQMMLLFLSGLLLAPFFTKKFPRFFEKYNRNGVPFMIVFLTIIIYWMLPRVMDEALELWYVELFKFISLPLLAGVTLRDSFSKLKISARFVFMFITAAVFSVTGLAYTFSESQLCNSYLIADQISVGLGLIAIGIGILGFIFLITFTDQTQYYKPSDDTT